METSNAATESKFSVHTAESVKEFLNYLLPSAEHWNSAKRGDLAYRGQASSRWLLVPKAFRPGDLKVYAPEASAEAPTRVVPQAMAEFHALRQFVKVADNAGLQITGAGGQLLSQEPPRHIFKDDWEYGWPAKELLETLALAQHHGIPTRLLDFTEDPLVGAYFAASSAWDPKKGQRLRGKDRCYLAVWVIDLRFIQALNRIGGRYPERVGEVRVPRANNSYLHAQFAFFLIDRGANDVMAQDMPLSIDRTVVERARFWNIGNRLARKGIKRTWFDDIPVRQVRLSTNLTGETLERIAGSRDYKSKHHAKLGPCCRVSRISKEHPVGGDGRPTVR